MRRTRRGTRDAEPTVPPRWALAAVFLLGVVVWGATVPFSFTLDDSGIVIHNAQVERFDVGAMFRTSLADGSTAEEELGVVDFLYRPLPKVTFALNRLVSGEAPWSYHLANALLHGAAAALVLALLRRVGLPPFAAAFGTTLFLLHPVHVEAVANVKHREEILAAIGVLLAWLASIRARAARDDGTAYRHALAAGAALLLALLSKESAIAALVLIPFSDIATRGPGKPFDRRLAAISAGLAVGGVAWLALRASAVGLAPTRGVEVFFTPDETFRTRLLTSAAVWAKYYFWKGALLHTYPCGFSSRSEVLVESGFPSAAAIAGLLLLAGSVAAAALAWRRGARRWAFWGAFFWIALVPTSNLPVPIGTVGAFRLLYLPTLAWGVLLGGALAALLARVPASARPRAAVAAILGPAACWSAISLAEGRHWRDDAALDASDIARTNNPRPRFAEAMDLRDPAARERGLLEVVRIMEAAPGSARGMETSLLARTYTELGDLALGRGDAGSADDLASKALDVLAPDARFRRYAVFPWTLRAEAAAARRDAQAEAAAWNACIAADPVYPRPYLELARIVAARSGPRAAVGILERGIAAIDASGYAELAPDRERLEAYSRQLLASGGGR